MATSEQRMTTIELILKTSWKLISHGFSSSFQVIAWQIAVGLNGSTRATLLLWSCRKAAHCLCNRCSQKQSLPCILLKQARHDVNTKTVYADETDVYCCYLRNLVMVSVHCRVWPNNWTDYWLVTADSWCCQSLVKRMLRRIYNALT